MADSEWTVATLKQYIDREFASSKEAVNAALAASEKAVLKAEVAADKRAEASNEIRAAMMDAQKHYATREGMDALSKRVDDLVNQQNIGAGKSQGVGQLVTVGLAIVAIGVSVLALWFHR